MQKKGKMKKDSTNIKDTMKDIYWLLAQATELQVRIDHWKMLLKRIRHEVTLENRELNVTCLNSAILKLNNLFEIYPSDKIEKIFREGKQYELLYAISIVIEEYSDSKRLKEKWNELKNSAFADCPNPLECKYDRKFKECPYIPCPRLMKEFEGYDSSPESLISRLNRKYKDTEYTYLGALLNKFCTKKVIDNISAIYFTFYYPGRVFDNLNMSTVR